jgi:hypothetical protein
MTTTTTTTTREFRLVVCGVCEGHGSIIRTDLKSAEFPPARKVSTCWACKGEGKHPVLPSDYDAWLLTLDTPEQPEPSPRSLAAVQTLTVHARQVQPGDVITISTGAQQLRGRFVVRRLRALSDGRTMIVFRRVSLGGTVFSGYHLAAPNELVTVDRV